IINNLRPKWGDESKIELKFVRKIGGVETQDENYVFYRPFDMVQDKEGCKYVLTGGGEFCIRKFDPDWKYIKRFGSRGEGPGEVLRTYGCAIDSQSNLHIVSIENRRLVILGPDGELKGNWTMPGHSHYAAVLSSGRTILTARSFQALDNEIIGVENSTMLAIVDSEGEIIKRFSKCKTFNEFSLMYVANNVFFDVDDRDNIYVTFQNQNRIEKYSSDGTPIFSVRRPLKYEIKHGTIFKDGFHWPRMTFVSQGIRVDDVGRLWVTTYEAQPESQSTGGAVLRNREWFKFEIYDKQGVLLGRIPTPVEFSKTRIYGSTLYLIDPYFEACVYEYRIVEK
ncbi:MAG: hypothetical protein JRJ85_24080, partial [Deltaproteobacteria bacterium]|nr:hypothetical protein [Deltaproteobacteria bacterium]